MVEAGSIPALVSTPLKLSIIYLLTQSIEEMMDNLRIVEKRPTLGGIEYLLSTTDDFKILAKDIDVLNIQDITTWREITISVSTGCPIGCLFCKAQERTHARPLMSSEMEEQVSLLVKERPFEDTETAISFAAMGDPANNAYNTINAIRALKSKSQIGKIIVPTAGTSVSPRLNKHLFDMARTTEIEYRFSCQSTDEEERKKLAHNPNVISFADIGKLAAAWPCLPIYLDFMLLKGYSYDPTSIVEAFPPGTVVITINSLEENQFTRSNNLYQKDEFETLSITRRFIEAGIDVQFRTI